MSNQDLYSAKCVNRHCNYIALNDICTKCGAVQDRAGRINQLEDELEKCYSEITDKEALIVELKRGNPEYSEFFEDEEE